MAEMLPPIPPKLQGLGRSVVRWLQDVVRIITTSDTTLATHTALTSAHGATGTIVGTGNVATAGTAGVVLKAAASTDASSSAVAVSSPDAATQGVSYSQANVQSIATLANELKADVTTVVTDLNAVASSLNDLKAKLRAAGIMTS